MTRKVLQVDFSGPWQRGGCLSHIAKAWVRNSKNYEQYFASTAGRDYVGDMQGQPHWGFDENAKANRIFNKILRLNKFCFFSLIPIIEKLRPDIIHFHNRHDLVDQVMAKLSYRPKVVCIYHQCYNKLYVPKSTDLIIGVCKLLISWIDRKADPDVPMAVLHNPFWKVPIPERQPVARPLFLNYANKSRCTRDVFNAVRILQAEGFDFEVRCFGHTYPDLPVPPNVTVSKTVPQPEFLEIAAKASAYICSTYATPCPIAVLEAFARKTPVICPWDIGTLDLMPSDHVIAFESHSAVTIADAMRTFLKMSDAERAALAERAYNLSSDIYSEARLTERLEYLYDTMYSPARV